MPIFCNTQTTVERQYFSSMKKRITWNSVETWGTKIIKTTDLFAGNHLLTAKTWERMLRHRPVYWNSCRVVWILRTAWWWSSRSAARH